MTRTSTKGRARWCRCGDTGDGQWVATHSRLGDGHKVVIDDYRALCLPHDIGCRQCGAIPQGRKVYYCSDECRDVFDANHFWGSARAGAINRASTWLIQEFRYEPKRHRDETFCQRCFAVVGSTWTDEAEVNHIVPVNGAREFFGCSNHQDNLEALCHACHLDVTAEQRRAGLIGKPRAQGVLL